MNLETLFEQSVSASILCLAVWILAPKVRNVSLRHLFWLMVLAKFVAPTTMEIGMLPSGSTSPSVPGDSLQSDDRLPHPAANVESVSSASLDSSNTLITNEFGAFGGYIWWQLLAMTIAYAGTAWVATTTAVRIYRFRRLLRFSDDPPTEITSKLAALSKRMGLRKPPRLRMIAAQMSPVVWPFGLSPTIVMPRPLLQKSDCVAIESLLIHELAHIRRRDHWVRWLEIVVTCLHWWNPFMWLARNKLHEAEESCCDAWVVRAMSDHRAAYAKTLLAVAAASIQPRGSHFSRLALEASGPKFLRNRIECIMKDSNPVGLTRSKKAAMAALSVAVLSCGLSIAKEPEAGEHKTLSELPHLQRIRVMERQFLNGQHDYRRGLENYRKSLQEYKRAGDNYNPNSAVYKNILTAYQNGRQAYVNGVEAYRQQIAKQRLLRDKLDQAISLWRQSQRNSATLDQERLLKEARRAAEEYLDFLSPKIHYPDGGQGPATTKGNGSAEISSRGSFGGMNGGEAATIRPGDGQGTHGGPASVRTQGGTGPSGGPSRI